MQADRESQSGVIQGVTEDTSVDEERIATLDAAGPSGQLQMV
jgi:hypothetical protein